MGRKAVNDHSVSRLIIRHELSYEAFREHHQPDIDFLIDIGIIKNSAGRIAIANVKNFLVLKELWENEAISYYYHSAEARAFIDDLAARSWLRRESSLLTTAEGSYINYQLNQSGFTDGPDLRNKYLHGSQGDGDDN